jgi:hypothetical protein
VTFLHAIDQPVPPPYDEWFAAGRSPHVGAGARATPGGA